MRLLVPAFFWMTLLLSAMADPASVRVAVINDAATTDLAALDAARDNALSLIRDGEFSQALSKAEALIEQAKEQI